MVDGSVTEELVSSLRTLHGPPDFWWFGPFDLQTVRNIVISTLGRYTVQCLVVASCDGLPHTAFSGFRFGAPAARSGHQMPRYLRKKKVRCSNFRS
jgi:hypothetical protein